MNVKITLHNVIVVTLLAALGITIARLAGKTPIGQMPVVGTFFNFVGAA